VLKGLFKDAVKALTRRGAADEQGPKARDRSGETKGEFQWLARIVSHLSTVRQEFKGRAIITSRYARIDPEAYAVATNYLSGTLDMLNKLNDGPGSDYGDGFNAISNPHSPHL
jgi:hypothetical protein